MIVPKNLSPSGLDLQTVKYPKHILDAAGTATPGADVTFEEALRAYLQSAEIDRPGGSAFVFDRQCLRTSVF